MYWNGKGVLKVGKDVIGFGEEIESNKIDSKRIAKLKEKKLIIDEKPSLKVGSSGQRLKKQNKKLTEENEKLKAEIQKLKGSSGNN